RLAAGDDEADVAEHLFRAETLRQVLDDDVILVREGAGFALVSLILTRPWRGWPRISSSEAASWRERAAPRIFVFAGGAEADPRSKRDRGSKGHRGAMEKP